MPAQHNKDSILVIGATGPVGKALLERLAGQGANVSAVTRKKSYGPNGIRVLRGDLSDASFCGRCLKGINTVFYTASHRKNIAWHVKEPWSFAEGNVAPLLNVLGALGRSSVKRFLYMSTIHVAYATDDNSPVDGYAFGKSINEMLVRAFAEQYPKVDMKIIRSTAVYGPHDSFDPDRANLIPAFIRKVDEAKGSMEIWGKGIRKMQFIYVDDVVDNLLAIARGTREKFFVLGNPAAYSIQQLADMVIKKFKKKLVITHDLGKPDKPTKLFAFHNKVKPKVSLSEGLEKTIQQYRKRYG